MLRTNDYELCSTFQQICRHFEELAIGLLEVCYKESTFKAKKLLRVPLTRFRLLRTADGHYLDCLELVHYSDSKRFLSHPACLAILRDEWYGDIDHAQSNLNWWARPLWLLGTMFKLTKEAEDRIKRVSE